MDTAIFNTFLVVMAVTALIVFIALHFINAGYGMLFDKKWGASAFQPHRLDRHGSSGIYRHDFFMDFRHRRIPVRPDSNHISRLVSNSLFPTLFHIPLSH